MLIFGYGGGFPKDNCRRALQKAENYGLDGVMLEVYKTTDDQLIIFQEKLSYEVLNNSTVAEYKNFGGTLKEAELFIQKDVCLL